MALQRCGLVSFGLLLSLGVVAGCGGGGTTPAPTSTATTTPSAAGESGETPQITTVAATDLPPTQTEVVTAALSAEEAEEAMEADDEPVGEVVIAEPDKGTPEWLIQEILTTRVLPFAELPEVKEGDAESAAAHKQALDDQKAQRRERNLKIVDLAKEAISKTHSDPEKERVFQAAVHHLLDAHSQLALQGDRESVLAIYDAAEAFYKKMPESDVAAEAQLTLVNLTHTHANMYGKTEPTWIEEFARQTQTYAQRFPKDVGRCVGFLVAAARSCEVNGLRSEAVASLTILQQQFPDHPVTQQWAGALRRLQLPGQKLELAGPTMDGNFWDVEEQKTKGVVIVFWSTTVPASVELLSKLAPVAKKYQKYSTVVCVNLDTDELAVDNFLAEKGISWPQIFFAEADKRGWSSPIATHYGLQKVPALWLVDPEGVVVDTELDASNIEPKLHETLQKYITAQRAIQPVSGQTPDTATK